MFTYTHAGKMGDILYSLYFCLEDSTYFHFDKFNYNIQINRRFCEFGKLDDRDEIILTQKDADFIIPLLRSLPYINEVTACATNEKRWIELNSFRSGVLCPYGCEIRDWYYTFTPHTFPREFWKPIIQVEPNPRYRDKILFTLTDRYVNRGLNYMTLEPFKDHLVFIGTDQEHRAFQEKYFELEKAELTEKDNLLTVAQYLAGAKGYVANQCGFFSLAELMKINRILLAPDWIELDGKIRIGPKNNLPLGGWCNNVSYMPKAVAAIRELLEM